MFRHGWSMGLFQASFCKICASLARAPTRWSQLIKKNSSKIRGLSMILPQKWLPPLRIMFEQLNCRLRAAALRSFPQQFMGDDNG